MKLTTMIKTAVAVVAMAAIATFAAPVALAAYPITGKLGSELTMTDTVGQVVLGWKVSDLKSSTAVIPGYPVAGQVWEATATVNAIRGSVTPAVSQFNARTADGINYRVLWPGCCGKPRAPTPLAEPLSPKANNRPAKSTSMSPAHRQPSSR